MYESFGILQSHFSVFLSFLEMMQQYDMFVEPSLLKQWTLKKAFQDGVVLLGSLDCQLGFYFDLLRIRINSSLTENKDVCLFFDENE